MTHEMPVPALAAFAPVAADVHGPKALMMAPDYFALPAVVLVIEDEMLLRMRAVHILISHKYLHFCLTNAI
jgi:hypothetical protein